MVGIFAALALATGIHFHCNLEFCRPWHKTWLPPSLLPWLFLCLSSFPRHLLLCLFLIHSFPFCLLLPSLSVPFWMNCYSVELFVSKVFFLLSRQAHIYSYCHTCRNLTHVVLSILRILHQESILPLFYTFLDSLVLKMANVSLCSPLNQFQIISGQCLSLNRRLEC